MSCKHIQDTRYTQITDHTLTPYIYHPTPSRQAAAQRLYRDGPYMYIIKTQPGPDYKRTLPTTTHGALHCVPKRLSLQQHYIYRYLQQPKKRAKDRTSLRMFSFAFVVCKMKSICS